MFASASSDSALRKLIRACVDDERTLEHERRFVDARRAESLTRFALEREAFIAELEKLGESEVRRPSRSWGEAFREARRSLWVIAAGRNNGDAIAACRRSRGRTEARYDEALQRSLPHEARRVIESHRRRLHDEMDELNHLLL